MRTAFFLAGRAKTLLNDFKVLKDFNDIRVFKVIRESRKAASPAKRT